MSLLIVGVIAIVIAFTFSSLSSKRTASFPPRVPSVLPWFGTALSYISSPDDFIARCRKQYGNVFRMLLGGREVVVLSSASAISSIYAADHNTLGTHEVHKTLYREVSGNTGNSHEIYRVVTHLIFPMVDQRLSRRAMGDLTSPIAQALYVKLKPYTRMKNVRLPLMKFLTEPLCYATNLVMFGSRYPENTYEDLRTLDATMPERFYKVPFWSWPSVRARKRMLSQIGDYLCTKDISEEDGWLGSAFKHLFRDNNIALDEASGHLLTFQWGMHTNTFGIALWLFLFLLRHPDALLAVRNEIDKTVKEDFGDLESFMASVNPQILDKPCFSLLTSAVLETMRLTAIFVALRVAESDVQLKDRGETVTIRKGEYVLGNVQAVHFDESAYPDNRKFVFDRFAHVEHREGRLPTDGHPWFSFAAGKHLCKGRYLAIYELKLVAILYLYLFDLSPVTNGSSSWWPPRTTRRNLGIPRAEEVFVDVRPRYDI
ncbi:cytochrome P450 [Pisolithus marmoratus]|nr:cytochrome P450 [Pisolithus marmoratus]